MGYSDVESGGGDVFQDPSLRWAFVQKVYGILSCQLLLTFVAAMVVVKVESVRLTVMNSPLLVIASAIVPFICKNTFSHAFASLLLAVAAGSCTSVGCGGGECGERSPHCHALASARHRQRHRPLHM
ncbi:unnamed protein product [Closterium sp. NIES-53]